MDPRTKTKEEIIKNFIKIHGDRYDYSRVIRASSKRKIIVICRKHGEFLISITNHNRGSGCIRCGYELQAKKRTKSKKQWLENFKKAHGNTYDYSKIKTIEKNITKIPIICPIHNIFYQAATNHAKGYGCSKCGRIVSAKKTAKSKKQWITKFLNVHGNTYDYSKIITISPKKKIPIICKKHGIFYQTAYLHGDGNGCNTCGYLKSGIVRKLHRKKPIEWLDRFKKSHGDRYDYSNSIIQNANTTIIIICSIHGNFTQSPSSHGRGSGCQECGKLQAKIALTHKRKKWIEKFKKAHGNTYDYSLANEIKSELKIPIICKEHGIFKQLADSHSSGNGCSNCKQISKNEEYIVSWLHDRKISFEREVRLVPQKQFRFDFQIIATSILLEYDGPHHFKPIQFGGMSIQKAKRRLQTCQRRDKLKSGWAKENGYELIRIKYDQDIEQELTERLLPLLEVEAT